MSAPSQSIAQLRNVSLFGAAMDDAISRHLHLPGLVVFHGPSGYGKTHSATYAANVHRAHYVEARDAWTKKALMMAIARELGVADADRLPIYALLDAVAESLGTSGRPLILDEADHILKAGAIELVRDIHEASGAVVALIGEERLPHKLAAFERVHNRVIQWVAAEPCDLADAQLLARLYCPKSAIADDLLERVIRASDGGARRVAVNLDHIQREAKLRPAATLDSTWWGDVPLVTGRVLPRTSFLPAGKAVAVVR